MEKHRCKLCFKNFVNGRALGGHMRSHVVNSSQWVPPETARSGDDQLGEEPESTQSRPSSSSASSSSEEENEDKSTLIYGLRENPKKSVRLVDPKFAFAVDAGSVVLQDSESETESSKNPIRRRSKRFQRHDYHDQYAKFQQVKRMKPESSWVDPEPVSSISDTTTEEDVAFCLMMLSRDNWKREAAQEDGNKFSYENSDEIRVIKTKTRSKYRCETCKKVFKSYQALGGHRASHKKIKPNCSYSKLEPSSSMAETENAGAPAMAAEEKIHECPVCFRIFSSGQALGGHKRSHVLGSSPNPKPPTRLAEKSFIDLNLPAPMDDDDNSQIELSVVSDADFIRPH